MVLWYLNTSYLKYFDLKLYDDGFVLLMPGRREPKKLPPFAPQRKIFQVQKESMEWGEMLEIPTVGALNDYIVHKDIHDLILIQEALQEQKIAQIARQIAEHREKKLIMIAGPSSSGKTTFSHRLTIQLSAHGLKPHPIAVDDYFINREDTPRDAEGNHDFECLKRWMWRSFSGIWQRFWRENGWRSPIIILRPDFGSIGETISSSDRMIFWLSRGSTA